MKMRFLIATALVSLAPVITVAQSPAGDYPLTLHVKASRLTPDCGDTHGMTVCSKVQMLTVITEGNTYELTGGTKKIRGVVALGDYKARVVKEEQQPTHEFTRTYEVLFPDGSKGEFGVVGQLE